MATEGFTARWDVRLCVSIAKALPPLCFRSRLTQLGRPDALHQGNRAFRSPVYPEVATVEMNAHNVVLPPPDRRRTKAAVAASDVEATQESKSDS